MASDDQTPASAPSEPRDPGRPLAELREHGLLWLINRVAFHPRGYALALHVDDDGTVTGWSMQGDGTEPWSYGTTPDGVDIDDLCFARAEAFLASLPPEARWRRREAADG